MDRKRHNGDLGQIDPRLAQRSADHPLSFKERKNICRQQVPLGICCFFNNERRVWVGNTDNQVLTPAQGSKGVLQVPTVKRLKSAVDHAITPLHNELLTIMKMNRDLSNDLLQ
jgi:hypothetical protein